MADEQTKIADVVAAAQQAKVLAGEMLPDMHAVGMLFKRASKASEFYSCPSRDAAVKAGNEALRAAAAGEHEQARKHINDAHRAWLKWANEVQAGPAAAFEALLASAQDGE